MGEVAGDGDIEAALNGQLEKGLSVTAALEQLGLLGNEEAEELCVRLFTDRERRKLQRAKRYGTVEQCAASPLAATAEEAGPPKRVKHMTWSLEKDATVEQRLDAALPAPRERQPSAARGGGGGRESGRGTRGRGRGQHRGGVAPYRGVGGRGGSFRNHTWVAPNSPSAAQLDEVAISNELGDDVDNEVEHFEEQGSETESLQQHHGNNTNNAHQRYPRQNSGYHHRGGGRHRQFQPGSQPRFVHQRWQNNNAPTANDSHRN